MAIDYSVTPPVDGASRVTKEVELWTDYADTIADVDSRLTTVETDGLETADIGVTVQGYDADLAALAGIAGVEGDIIYRNATQWTRLAKGTAGQVLAVNAGATAPEWTAASGGGGGGAFSGAKLTKSATQSLAHEAFTPITFNGETYDTASYHDNSTNPSRITIPTTGYYAFTGNVEWAAPAGAVSLIAGIRVNGTDLQSSWVRWSAAASSSNVQPVVVDLSLTAGDYVELIGRQNSGSALNVGTFCSFSCRFLGA